MAGEKQKKCGGKQKMVRGKRGKGAGEVRRKDAGKGGRGAQEIWVNAEKDAGENRRSAREIWEKRGEMQKRRVKGARLCIGLEFVLKLVLKGWTDASGCGLVCPLGWRACPCVLLFFWERIWPP